MPQGGIEPYPGVVRRRRATQRQTSPTSPNPNGIAESPGSPIPTCRSSHGTWLRPTTRLHNPFRIGSLVIDVPGVDRFADQPRAMLQNPVGIRPPGCQSIGEGMCMIFIGGWVDYYHPPSFDQAFSPASPSASPPRRGGRSQRAPLSRRLRGAILFSRPVQWFRSCLTAPLATLCPPSGTDRNAVYSNSFGAGVLSGKA